MSYEKTNWQTGDVVTAEKLNKLENGVENATELPSVTAEDDGDVLTVVSGAWAKATPSGGGVFLIEAVLNADGIYLNKSYSEVKEALFSGKSIIIQWNDDDNTVYSTGIVKYCWDNGDDSYTINILFNGSDDYEFEGSNFDYPLFYTDGTQ